MLKKLGIIFGSLVLVFIVMTVVIGLTAGHSVDVQIAAFVGSDEDGILVQGITNLPGGAALIVEVSPSIQTPLGVGSLVNKESVWREASFPLISI